MPRQKVSYKTKKRHHLGNQFTRPRPKTSNPHIRPRDIRPRPPSGPRDKRSYFSIGKHYVQIRGQNGGGGVVYATSKVIQAKSIRRTEGEGDGRERYDVTVSENVSDERLKYQESREQQ
ncbi:hypothetical protein J6590_103993 [Homalodisca vitripennis]|nr:hypothetical protein J6590_103993 [Homalodisca vitripennis]